jgi:hypothetical protein
MLLMYRALIFYPSLNLSQELRLQLVMVVGLAEHPSVPSVRCAKANLKAVEALFDSLGLGAISVNVHRMGRPDEVNDASRPRLLKLVLP